MSDPTLVISIDRTSLSLSALTFSGTPGVGELGVTGYQEPQLQPRLRTVGADDIHGERTQAWKWQQAILSWTVVTDASATEAETRALVAEIRAAVSRLSYSVTVTVNGATAEVWSCTVGSVNYVGERTYNDLADHNPVLEVSIPCHPVRS